MDDKSPTMTCTVYVYVQVVLYHGLGQLESMLWQQVGCHQAMYKQTTVVYMIACLLFVAWWRQPKGFVTHSNCALPDQGQARWSMCTAHVHTSTIVDLGLANGTVQNQTTGLKPWLENGLQNGLNIGLNNEYLYIIMIAVCCGLLFQLLRTVSSMLPSLHSVSHSMLNHAMQHFCFICHTHPMMERCGFETFSETQFKTSTDFHSLLFIQCQHGCVHTVRRSASGLQQVHCCSVLDLKAMLLMCCRYYINTYTCTVPSDVT